MAGVVPNCGVGPLLYAVPRPQLLWVSAWQALAQAHVFSPFQPRKLSREHSTAAHERVEEQGLVFNDSGR